MISNVNELKTVIQMKQKQLKIYLEAALKKMGYLPESHKGFLYAKGSIPVLLVAHLDTVHCGQAEIICFSEDLRYVMSPQGIGGDDRCGVYMILQIIRQAKCHVLFCEDEEIGGRGAGAFAGSKIMPKVNYIVEIDRKSENDAVFYKCDNPSFTDFVLGFGFEERSGSFSDISVVAPHLNTAAVNISAGYYNEHKRYEYIDMLAVENNIRRITQMVLTDTGHFNYIKRNNQLSLVDWMPAAFPSMVAGGKQRLLMDVPAEAHIITNGCEICSGTTYLIDRASKVYIYLKELNAAVESEYCYACGDNGEQIAFSDSIAKILPVISFEEAVERLTMNYG